jgi:hypothetical protein
MTESGPRPSAGKALPVRDENWAAREIDGETVLIPLRAGAADLHFLLVLNATAAFIWGQLDGTRDLDQVASSVADAFDVSLEEAAADVRALLESFREVGLIQPPQSVTEPAGSLPDEA